MVPGDSQRKRFARRVRPAGVLAIGVALLLSACTGGASAPGASSAPVAKTDTSKLVVAVPDLGKQNYRPWLIGREEIVMHEVLDTLTRVDPKTGNLVGGLAESWALSPDLKTWTFKLRANVPFHDPAYGTVTADDVKFSWEQFTQKDSVQSRAGVYRQAVDSDMKNFVIVGPLEFKLTATKPVVYLPSSLSNQTPGLPISSKKYWETKPAEAAVHPIGTGPFKFVSSTQGVEVQLQAVENHWRQTPAFKAVTIRIIPDDASRLANVASGGADFAPIPQKLVGEAKANNLGLLFIPDVASWSITFGGMYPGDPKNYTPDAPWIQASAPEKGLAIRQALSYSLDRKTILDKLYSGNGTIPHAPFFEYPANPQLVDSSWPMPAYDVAKAKQLLAQGGYPNGFDVTVPIYEAGSGGIIMSETFASYFEAIGIKVKRLVADYTAVIAPAIRAKATQGWIYVQGYGPGGEVLQKIENSFLLTSNFSRTVDPVILAARDKLLVEQDATKRYAIAREMIGQVIAKQLGIPILVSGEAYAVGKKIGTWSPAPGLGETPASFETITPK